MCSVHSLLTSVPRLILLRSCWGVPDRHILVHWYKGSFCHVYGVTEQVVPLGQTLSHFNYEILPISNLRRNKFFLTFSSIYEVTPILSPLFLQLFQCYLVLFILNCSSQQNIFCKKQVTRQIKRLLTSLQASSVVWEDFTSKAAKLHTSLK